MFSKSRRSSSRKSARKSRFANHFSIECLERREMFAANFGPDMASLVASSSDVNAPAAAVAFEAPATAAKPINLPTLGAGFADGVLTVTGTNGVDSINISAHEGTVYVHEVVKGLTLLTLPADELTSIVVNANSGNDWVNVDQNSISVMATIKGGAGDDILMGGAVGDVLDGGSGNDRLVGHGGNDAISGGQGDDLVVGGDGNDSVYGNEGSDYLLGGNGDDLVIGEAGDDQLFGEAGNDYVIGGAGQNLLDGGDGSDHLYGGDEADDIFGGAGDDIIFGYAGNDGIRGEAGQDNITAGDGADMVDGGDGKDVIRGEGGNDALSGGAGNDYIYGGDNLDWISGDSGNDALYGEAGKDWLQGGYGTDLLNGGSGDNKLHQDYAAGAEPMGQVASAAFYNNAGDFLDAIEDGANGAGNFLTEVANWTLDAAITVGGLYVSWLTNLDDRVLRLGDDLATTLSNWPWESEFWDGMGRALVDCLEIVGLGEAWQLYFTIYFPWQRGLTDAEIDVAASVFGDSINFHLVRVNEHSLMNLIGDATAPQGSGAHVQGYIINSHENISRATLIHELVHVWQYEEDGLIYIPEALGAQDGGAGYDYANGAADDDWDKKSTALQEALDNDKGLTDFNREQQGDIIEDYYELRKEIIDEADGAVAAEKRGYLEAFIPFVTEVSTLSKNQLRVPAPSASDSSDDDAPGKTIDSPTGLSKVDMATLPILSDAISSSDLAREAEFAQLSPASVQSTAVASILQSLDSGPTVGTNPALVAAPSTPAVVTNSNVSKPGKTSALGGLSSSPLTTRALDRAFGMLV